MSVLIEGPLEAKEIGSCIVCGYPTKQRKGDIQKVWKLFFTAGRGGSLSLSLCEKCLVKLEQALDGRVRSKG